jgi:hypothetical protein
VQKEISVTTQETGTADAGNGGDAFVTGERTTLLTSDHNYVYIVLEICQAVIK